jgi:N-acyl amino acid synthase of PEP-CTERM/exosortase system
MDRHRLFDHDYETILADTTAGRRIHHQIRYRVFCEETGFEDSQAFPEQEEFDRWDRHSVPFIVRARRTQEWIATVRLILPGTRLPSQELCILDRGAIAKIKPGEVAELSRLCVVPSFRGRRYQDRLQSSNNVKMTPLQKSQIMLGLLRACAAYSHGQDIRYWYFLTTSGLARMINRLHLHMHPIGMGIEHRGKRYPFLANIEKSKAQAERRSPELARLFNHPRPFERYSTLAGEAAELVWGETRELELDRTA